MTEVRQILDRFPTYRIGHWPTPVEAMPNLGRDLGIELFVKRDDCSGVGFGGNKVRQLEYYLGAAMAEDADTILITGAIQSNFVRTAAAFARKAGMDCHIQLEERVPDVDTLYRTSGNVLLDRLLGATLHEYPEGEDEAGADAALQDLADDLLGKGKRPYIVHLGPGHPTLGALGYVDSVTELGKQLRETGPIDVIVVASGSAATHSGILVGLRALNMDIAVQGICVRRAAGLQKTRVADRCADLSSLMDIPSPVADRDIQVYDGALAPGYGQVSPGTVDAIRRTARSEGLFLDPVYTGKVMDGLIQLAEAGAFAGKRVLFWHTGGQPALFGYGDQLV